MAEEVEDPLVGKVLNGRFHILEPLGVGGMGRVYKAMQQPLDRLVALKVLNPKYDGTKDPGFQQRFFLEASMTAKLKHPNTVTVHDYGRTEDGIFYIAMEYIDGDTLQQVLREGPLSWQRALGVGAQVARSLREAHKLGLVHRDLKPANVMLLREATGGDAVKVLDFGLVKSFTPDRPKGPESTELTQAGVLMGSPLYMAPEQARNEADQRTDIYALGILLFQCITGRPPFHSKESIDVIVKHLKEKPPQLRSLRPEVPLEVDALVMRCLEKRPQDRFQSMDELLEAMRGATSGQGLSGLFTDPRTSSASGAVPRAAAASQALRAGGPRSLEIELSTPTAPTRRSPMLIIAVGLAVVGLAAGAALAVKLLRSDEPPVAAVRPAVPKPPDGPAPKPPEAVPRAPAPVQVTFDVQSDPPGATVTRNGEPVGVTPVTLILARTGEESARVELGFSLAGYQSTSLVVEGREGTVPVRQALKKKAGPPVTKLPGKKRDPQGGYKDDPYQ